MVKQVKGLLRLLLIDFLRRTRILQVLKQLRKHQYLAPEALIQIRKSNFDHLLQLAWSSTRYYAPYHSYEELPVLTKEQIRANFNDFISSSYQKKLYTKATGGSTGTPLLYHSTTETQSYLWAGILLSWEAAGYQLGDKVAFVAGTSLIRNSFKHWVFYKLLNVDLYSVFTLNDEDIQRYISEIKRRKTQLIYGYADALGTIAHYLNTTEPVSFPHLKAIVSTSEVLTPGNRARIEQAFGVKVFNQYGVNEGGIAAFECEQHNMHLVSTRCMYEVDSNGNLISTDLVNEGFILIKYDTGDRVEFSTEAGCACKRTFPIIKRVVGRSNDMVIDRNNKVVHSGFFSILFREEKSVEQFQVCFDKEKILINIKTDSQKRESDYKQYLDIIREHLQFRDYQLIINAPFFRSENAKHKFIIDQRS